MKFDDDTTSTQNEWSDLPHTGISPVYPVKNDRIKHKLFIRRSHKYKEYPDIMDNDYKWITEYEDINIFMNRITTWINDNSVQIIAIIPVETMDIVVFYY